MAKPHYVHEIDGKTLDSFVSRRLVMSGKKKGDTISRATVKKELRTILAALGRKGAKKWGYISDVPPMPEFETFGKDKPFVLETHFDAMMNHCHAARLPNDQHYSSTMFWQALLATLWVTGLRKSAILALRWDDVDLDAGEVFSRYRDNKSKKDQRHKILAVVPRLQKLHSVRRPGELHVFPWNYSLVSLDRDLTRIQKSAGIHLPCREEHEHTDACHLYGFHSIRYAHATYNFGRVSDRDLQEQMGHASFNTTKHYIKYAESHQQRDYDVYLPKSLKTSVG